MKLLAPRKLLLLVLFVGAEGATVPCSDAATAAPQKKKAPRWTRTTIRRRSR